MSDELPPLPTGWSFAGLDHKLYTADQMRAYARAAVEREREACALIAQTPAAGEQDDITMSAKDRIAAAIRARAKERR